MPRTNLYIFKRLIVQPVFAIVIGLSARLIATMPMQDELLAEGTRSGIT